VTGSYERIVDALRANGHRVIERGDGKAQAQCPAHDDHNPSLSIYPRTDGKGTSVKCHTGCDYAAVLESIGLHPRDLYDDARMRDVYRPNIDYIYPNGDRKRRRAGPNGTKRMSWQKGRSGGDALYLGDKIPAGCPLVYLCESEKAAQAIWLQGAVAVATGGATRPCDLSPLRGVDVTVVVDRDSAGLQWAARQRKTLDGVAAAVRYVRCALDIPKADAVEHIDAGLTLIQLEEFDPFTTTYDDEPAPADPSGDDGDRDDTAAEAIPQPKLWSALDLKPAAQPRWLAKNRIPLAAVSLIIGEEGIGKSLLWVWVTAAVTTGTELAGFGIPAREPGRVVIAAITEDDWCSVVRPRLEVAGADLSMIDVVCIEEDGSGAPIYPRDIELIRQADPKPLWVAVDAWLDTVPATLRVRDPQESRLALHPWKELATTTGAAVSLICHTNRVASATARDRYGATAELRKKARMSLYCQTDDDARLVVGPEKANGVTTVAASLFTIEPVPVFQPTDEHDGTVPRLLYAGESDQTARQHVADAFAGTHDAAGGKDDVVGWLAAYLGEGPQWVTSIYRSGEVFTYSKDQLKRAKRRLHAESAHDGNTDAWFWHLPQHQGSAPAPVYRSLAPLLPCSNTENQGSSSTSQESKRVHRDTRGEHRSLALTVLCRFCGDEIPETMPLAQASGYCTKARCIQASRTANTEGSLRDEQD
jgi:hypothetical protein